MHGEHKSRLWKKSVLDASLISLTVLCLWVILLMPREIKTSVSGIVISGDTAVLWKQERFYLPVKYITESMGYAVGWDASQKRITFDNGQSLIMMRAGELEYVKNGETFYMREKSFVQENRTYMLIDDFAEMFDCGYMWDEDSYTIVLE